MFFISKIVKEEYKMKENFEQAEKNLDEEDKKELQKFA